MTVNFQPDLCLPKDPAGWGRWLTGHYYEHLQMIPLCAALAQPAIVPNYDILAWRDEPEFVQQWLVSHQEIHIALENACNVTGIDFSLVDFSNEEEFLEWQDDHSQEHITLRAILGIS
jgi:hypothetical protein